MMALVEIGFGLWLIGLIFYSLWDGKDLAPLLYIVATGFMGVIAIGLWFIIHGIVTF